MKKLTVFIVILLTIFLVGCEVAEDKKPEALEEILGGWETYKDGESLEIAKDDKKVFDSAIKNYKDEELELVALLGKQVVAGTNYMFLCKNDIEWKIVIVYKDLKDKVSVSYIKELDYTLYTGKDIDFASEDVAGGWEVNKKIETGKIDKDINKIFDKVNSEYTKLDLKPITILGTQIVAGTNYAVLALGKDSDKNYSINVVTIYVDLDNNSELTSVAYVDLGTYNK